MSSSSPFKAIFKSVQHQRDINDFYQKISTFPPVANKGVPRVFYVRTEAEAQQYRARLPTLWEICRTVTYTLVDGVELYLCPKLVDIPANTQHPAPKTFPTVEGNVLSTISSCFSLHTPEVSELHTRHIGSMAVISELVMIGQRGTDDTSNSLLTALRKLQTLRIACYSATRSLQLVSYVLV